MNKLKKSIIDHVFKEYNLRHNPENGQFMISNVGKANTAVNMAFAKARWKEYTNIHNLIKKTPDAWKKTNPTKWNDLVKKYKGLHLKLYGAEPSGI